MVTERDNYPENRNGPVIITDTHREAGMIISSTIELHLIKTRNTTTLSATDCREYLCRTKSHARGCNKKYHGPHAVLFQHSRTTQKYLSHTCICTVVERIGRTRGGRVLRHNIRCHCSRPRCQYYASVASTKHNQTKTASP